MILKGFPLLIDDEDFELVRLFNWSVHCVKSGGHYWARKYSLGDGRTSTIYLHRQVAERMGMSKDLHIDHINRVKHDNRRSNLRGVDRSGNARNKDIQELGRIYQEKAAELRGWFHNA